MKTRAAQLALALAPLAGCGGGESANPYANMEMQAPAQAGGAIQDEDPALRAEREYNAQFAHPKR